jgi:myosin-5
LFFFQIQKILLLYTPVDEYEEKFSRSFVDKVTAQLRELRQNELEEAQQALVIDTQTILPITIPFNPSGIGLETIDVPEQLNLYFLKRI